MGFDRFKQFLDNGIEHFRVPSLASGSKPLEPGKLNQRDLDDDLFLRRVMGHSDAANARD